MLTHGMARSPNKMHIGVRKYAVVFVHGDTRSRVEIRCRIYLHSRRMIIRVCAWKHAAVTVFRMEKDGRCTESCTNFLVSLEIDGQFHSICIGSVSIAVAGSTEKILTASSNGSNKSVSRVIGVVKLSFVGSLYICINFWNSFCNGTSSAIYYNLVISLKAIRKST